VAVELLLTVADLLAPLPEVGGPLPGPPGSGPPGGGSAAAAALAAKQDELARHVISRRLKSLYFHLSSGSRPRAAGALALLCALCSRGGASTRDLVHSFDFSLSALPKLARPARCVPPARARAPPARRARPPALCPSRQGRRRPSPPLQLSIPSPLTDPRASPLPRRRRRLPTPQGARGRGGGGRRPAGGVA